MRRALLLAASIAVAAACGHPASAPLAATQARFEVAALEPASRDFFALPFPTDLRRTSTGLELANFPNPGNSSTLLAYEEMLREDGPGFAGAAPLTVSFSGAIDSSSVTAASVFVVDLDAAGLPRTPLVFRYADAAGLFLPAHSLSARPVYGVPLAPGHRHALVVTTAVKDAAGKAIGPSAGMLRALGLAGATAADAAAVTITAPLVAASKSLGLPLSTVALASVFSVQDAAAPIAGLRRGVQGAAAPTASDLSFFADTASTHLFVGHLALPSFQEGSPPYLQSGGRIHFDAAGTAIEQHVDNVRVMLALPKGPPPATGFPVVLYAHGTGGWYLQAACEGIADLLAARGIASLGVDQVEHGPRNPACAEPAPDPRFPLCLAQGQTGANYESCVGLDYFNLFNPWAGRDNTRQGAADLFQLTRFAKSVSVPASLHPEHVAAALDAGRIAFLGHSQGGLTGAPYVASEPDLRSAVLSGTGGTLGITLLQRVDPLDFKAAAELLLGIAHQESLDEFHPVVALIEAAGEAADPLSYGPHFVKDPIGGTSRDVMLTEGLLDPFTVPDASESLGAAALFDLGGVAAHQSDGFTARGLRVLPLPLQQNLAAPDAKRTGVLLQYPGFGHFAIFDSPVAKCRYLDFLESSLKTGIAVVNSCSP